MLFQKLGRKGKKGGKEETGKYILKIISKLRGICFL